MLETMRIHISGKAKITLNLVNQDLIISDLRQIFASFKGNTGVIYGVLP